VKGKKLIFIVVVVLLVILSVHSCLYNHHDGEFIYEPYAGGLYKDVLADNRENTTVPWEYIDSFQIFYNEDSVDSTHTDSTEYKKIAAAVEDILSDTMLYPVEYTADIGKDYQKSAEALFDEMYLNAAVKIQLSTEAAQDVPYDKMYLLMIRIGITDESGGHVFLYYRHRSDISLDCICNIYTIQDEAAIRGLAAFAEEMLLLKNE